MGKEILHNMNSFEWKTIAFTEKRERQRFDGVEEHDDADDGDGDARDRAYLWSVCLTECGTGTGTPCTVRLQKITTQLLLFFGYSFVSHWEYVVRCACMCYDVWMRIMHFHQSPLIAHHIHTRAITPMEYYMCVLSYIIQLLTWKTSEQFNVWHKKTDEKRATNESWNVIVKNENFQTLAAVTSFHFGINFISSNCGKWWLHTVSTHN